MKNVSKKDLQRFENALKHIHCEGEHAPEPSEQWQQNVMREVRNIDISGHDAGAFSLLLRDLRWPLAQLAFTLVILIGVYLLNDNLLSSLDLDLFYAESPVSTETLISYYSF